MRLIKQKAELLPWEPGIEGIYKAIEKAGRTCYKSEDKITEGSAKPFVDRMIASNHLAMLEHGTVYLKMPGQGLLTYTTNHNYENYRTNKYSKVVRRMTYDNPNDVIGIMYAYITTNLRVLVENGWLDDLKYLCDPTEYHKMRYSFKLTTSIGVTRELNRHRVHSIAEQSTRYCNYSKNKFGSELTFIKPSWFDRRVAVTINGKYIPADAKGDFTQEEARLIESLSNAEASYIYFIKCGWQPQQAREILPLCTASEIVHTAFASDWRYFFDLRLFECTGKVHPNMKELAQLMYDEADKQGILFDIIYDSRTIN